MKRALVKKINYAGLEFDGLMLPDGSYAIAVPQLVQVGLLASGKTATRDLQRILGNSFVASKVMTEVDKNKVNVISLETFTLATLLLFQKGHEVATRFVMASVQEKLERIFDAGFGKVVEEREREARFFARLDTKETFRPMTDELQKQGFVEPWQYGKYIRNFQEFLDVECGTRDFQPLQKLLLIARCQSVVTQLMRMGYTPYSALKAFKENFNS